MGMSAPLSGPQGSYGQALSTGAKACLARANEQGGVYGWPVELVLLDDAGDPARTLDNARSLLRDARVLGLMAYVGADSTAAALPAINEARIPLIGAATGVEQLREQSGRHVFYLRAGHREEAVALMTQLDHMSLARVALVHQNDGLGNDGVMSAKIELARLALAPAAVVSIEADGRDAAAVARRVADAGVAAVVMVAGVPATASFVRQMKALDQTPRCLATSDVDGELLSQQLGPLARGIGIAQVAPMPGSSVRPLTRSACGRQHRPAPCRHAATGTGRRGQRQQRAIRAAAKGVEGVRCVIEPRCRQAGAAARPQQVQAVAVTAEIGAALQRDRWQPVGLHPQPLLHRIPAEVDAAGRRGIGHIADQHGRQPLTLAIGLVGITAIERGAGGVIGRAGGWPPRRIGTAAESERDHKQGSGGRGRVASHPRLAASAVPSGGHRSGERRTRVQVVDGHGLSPDSKRSTAGSRFSAAAAGRCRQLRARSAVQAAS
jgi:ABC-type branched-subunit amino acid transport system substrate-binding protein